jgi:antitoxin HigA-1
MQPKWTMRTTIERTYIMSEMHSPPHPGAILADTVLGQDGGKSVSAFADELGISRVTLSRVVNGRAAVSVDMALALAEATGTSPESWLNMQTAYDLWKARVARRKPQASLKPIRARAIRERVAAERQSPSRQTFSERSAVRGWTRDTGTGMVAFNRAPSARSSRVAVARKKK